ncbi:MAG: hypothetical protein J5732_09125 [Bacteroidaceae bacterium]|nr:hypothetical protein [Bacteroidaceae bacterium]
MKYAPSIAFEEMSGSAKGVTAAKAKGRKYLRNRGYGKKTTTASQSTVKGIFKQLSQSWKNLTVAQIKAWNNLAQSQAGRSILGSSAKISGLNLYQRLNFWIIRCGGNAVANPPALVGVDAPAAATVQLTDQAFNKSVYTFLTDRWLVNVPICLLMLYCFIRWWIIIWHDCDICFHRLILCILWLVILYYKSNVEYAQIFKGFELSKFFVMRQKGVLWQKLLCLVCEENLFIHLRLRRFLTEGLE